MSGRARIAVTVSYTHIEKIQEVIQFARGEAERQAGPDASLALLRSLLRQYPNSLELKLNGAAVLAAFWLILDVYKRQFW